MNTLLSEKPYTDMRRNLVWYEKTRTAIHWRATYSADPEARALKQAHRDIMLNASEGAVARFNEACDAYREARTNA